MPTIKSLTNGDPLIILNSYSENSVEKKESLKKIKTISQQTNILHLHSHDENRFSSLLIKNDEDIRKTNNAKMITLKNVLKFIIGVSFFPYGVAIYRKVSSIPHYDINSYIDGQNQHLLLNMSSTLINEKKSLPALIEIKKNVGDNSHKTIKKKQSILIIHTDIITRRNKWINAKLWRYRKNVRKPMLKHIRMENTLQAWF